VKVPQEPADAQAAVQSTPWLFVAVVVADRLSDDSAASVAGGAGERLTLIGVLLTMFTIAVFEIEGSVTDLAVIVTVPPVGMDVGAIYVTCVVVALASEPQAELTRLLQLSDQVTPALLESLATIAVSCAL
jgi:hypothetical protein